MVVEEDIFLPFSSMGCERCLERTTVDGLSTGVEASWYGGGNWTRSVVGFERSTSDSCLDDDQNLFLLDEEGLLGRAWLSSRSREKKLFIQKKS